MAKRKGGNNDNDKQKQSEPEQRALTIREAFEKGIVGSKVKIPRKFTSIVDRLVIIANEYGIDETAELLNVDLDLLDHAMQGGAITSRQEAILEHAYSGLELSDETDIDFEEVDKYAENLQQAIIFVNEQRYVGNRLRDGFRYAVAEGRVDIENDLSKNTDFLSYGLFADLNAAQKDKLISWLGENDEDTDEPHLARDFFAAYVEDMQDGNGIWSDVEASHFWKWFRETFYA